MQVKSIKLQQECEQLSSVKERLSMENQQIANELKVCTRKEALLSQYSMQ